MFGNDLFDACNGKCVAVLKRQELEPLSRIPISDLVETESSVIATFELPGVEKEDIQLNVTEDSIVVKVEKNIEKEADEKEGYSYEIRSHSFYSALPLPAEVDADNSNASYKNGILKVEIPKAKKQTKRIEVK